MRIVIVEDHLMFREVLRKVCETDLRHEVVGESGDGAEAVPLILRLQPDLVLLDLHLPNLDGFGVAEGIRAGAPDTRILVLSSHCDEYTVFRAERSGVQGFVDKNTNSVAALREAIGLIAAGSTSFSPAFKRIRDARARDPISFDKILGNRERAIVALVGVALTDKQIAKRLRISVETVAKHRLNVVRKLGLANTTELMRYAREHGFTLVAPKAGGDVMLP